MTALGLVTGIAEIGNIMKISRLIASGLVSGALRMRPEVVDVLKKLSDGGKIKPEGPPAEERTADPAARQKKACLPEF